MYLNQLDISPEARAREIVEKDYRAADVFNRYEINYCCGLQWPLRQACELGGVELDELMGSLRQTCRTVTMPSHIVYDKWPVDFLIDYIVNIHHQYLYTAFPDLKAALNKFIEEHDDRFPHFKTLRKEFEDLCAAVLPHLSHEEETIFPYLRQVAHAYEDHKKDTFAALLVKTLRKPLNSLMDTEHRLIVHYLSRFRELTGNYEPPKNACPSHRVLLEKLRELDNDLVQHFFLENEVLITRVMAMEQDILQRNS